MVSPIDSTWYQDANWTHNLAPAVTSTQTPFNSAKTALVLASPGFQLAQSNLASAISASNATASSVQAALANYNLQAGIYLNDVTSYYSSSHSYVTALNNEVNSVNSQATNALDNYRHILQNTLGDSLNSQGVVTSTLGSQLNTADNQMLSDYADVQLKETAFISAQTAVNVDRANLVSLQSQLLVAQAQLKIDQLTSPPVSQSVLDADNALVASLQTQVTNAITTLTSDVATRNSKKTALLTSISTYETSISTFSSLLSQGRTASSQSIDITALQDAVDTFMSQALADDQASDLAELAAHNLSFATDPTFLQNQIAAANTAVQESINQELSAQVTASPEITGSIQLPKLQPGTAMSITDLMRLITGIQLILSRLTTELSEADKNISITRMKIWSLQISLLTGNAAAVQAWLKQVQAADTQYQIQVAKDNVTNSQTAVDAVNNVLNHLTQINSIISHYNSEISQQNTLNTNTVNALNNSNIIATDVTNFSATIVPNNINNANDVTTIQNAGSAGQDTTIPTPTPVSTPATVAPLPTIPTIPLLDASHLTIPASFPIEPDDPTKPVSATNLPTSLPTVGDVTDLNSTIKHINDSLFPIAPQLAQFHYQPIEPFFLRASITERIAIDSTGLPAATDTTSTIIATIVKQAFQRDQENELVGAFQGLLKEIDISSLPTLLKQYTTTEPTGGGVGILHADILGSQAKIINAMIEVIKTGLLQNTLGSLVQQGALTGGLLALAALPTKPDNVSILGLTRNEQLLEKDTLVDQNVRSVEKEAAHQTVKSIIGLSENDALLQQEAISLLAKIPHGDLNQDEIKQLIGELKALIQILLLIVAALVAASSGEDTNLESITQAVSQSSTNVTLASITKELQQAGITLPTNIQPTSANFESELVNALLAKLPEPQNSAFRIQIQNILTSQNITPSASSPPPVTAPIEPKAALFQTPTQPTTPQTEPSTLQTTTPIQPSPLIAQARTASSTPHTEPAIGPAPLPTETLTQTQTPIQPPPLIAQERTASSTLHTEPPIRPAPLPTEPSTLQTKTPIQPSPLITQERTASSTLHTELPIGPAPLPTEPSTLQTKTPIQPNTLIAQTQAQTPPQVPENLANAIQGLTNTQIPAGKLLDFRRVVLDASLQAAKSVANIPGSPAAETPAATTPAAVIPAAAIPTSNQGSTLAEKVRTEVGKGFSTLPSGLLDTINTQLNKTAPQVPGLSNEDRNTFAAALATGLLSQPKAQELLSTQINENLQVRRPHVAARIKQTSVPPPQPETTKEDITSDVQNAYQRYALAVPNSKIAVELLSRLASVTRDRADFFKRSIDLILDPARFMVRNFSVFTQGTDRGPGQTPLSIPISG